MACGSFWARVRIHTIAITPSWHLFSVSQKVMKKQIKIFLLLSFLTDYYKNVTYITTMLENEVD